MATEFQCENMDDMVYVIEGKEFKYSECDVLSERDSEFKPMLDIILRSAEGFYADINVQSSDRKFGKAAIRRGTYDGKLCDEETAKTFAGYARAFSNKS